MARQALTEPATDLGPAEIAGVLCGAQVLSAAELSIGRRSAGATRADVQRALWEDRTLVKTFGPRGTVHLLAEPGQQGDLHQPAPLAARLPARGRRRGPAPAPRGAPGGRDDPGAGLPQPAGARVPAERRPAPPDLGRA
jgi:hypothetical protein